VSLGSPCCACPNLCQWSFSLNWTPCIRQWASESTFTDLSIFKKQHVQWQWQSISLLLGL
jgi:hypothetical protein